MSTNDAAVEAVVDKQLGSVKELDEDIFAYILGIVKDVDSHGCDPETLLETVSDGHHHSPSVGYQLPMPTPSRGLLIQELCEVLMLDVGCTEAVPLPAVFGWISVESDPAARECWKEQTGRRWMFVRVEQQQFARVGPRAALRGAPSSLPTVNHRDSVNWRHGKYSCR